MLPPGEVVCQAIGLPPPLMELPPCDPPCVRRLRCDDSGVVSRDDSSAITDMTSGANRSFALPGSSPSLCEWLPSLLAGLISAGTGGPAAGVAAAPAGPLPD